MLASTGADMLAGAARLALPALLALPARLLLLLLLLLAGAAAAVAAAAAAANAAEPAAAAPPSAPDSSGMSSTGINSAVLISPSLAIFQISARLVFRPLWFRCPNFHFVPTTAFVTRFKREEGPPK
jgi:hypothetical protein